MSKDYSDITRDSFVRFIVGMALGIVPRSVSWKCLLELALKGAKEEDCDVIDFAWELFNEINRDSVEIAVPPDARTQ